MVRLVDAGPSAVLVPGPDPAEIVDPIGTARHAYEALRSFGADGATSVEWREAADVAQRTFERHRSSLIEAGLVVRVGAEFPPRYRVDPDVEVD